MLRDLCSTTTQVQGADASVFRRLCSQYELVFSPLSNNHVAAPTLPHVLLQAETLYVTTDAGVQQISSYDPCANAGLGVVITDVEHYFHAAWGLRVAAASSSVLDWLTKFLALHLVLTMGFKGHIFFFCDNASKLLREMTQWMKLNSGLDRFVKHVLGTLNFCNYHEFWLAAQHNSHHTGMAAGWQCIADTLATQAQTNVHEHPLPWWWFFRCLDDAPSFLLFRSSLFLTLVRSLLSCKPWYRRKSECLPSKLLTSRRIQRAGLGFVRRRRCQYRRIEF